MPHYEVFKTQDIESDSEGSLRLCVIAGFLDCLLSGILKSTKEQNVSEIGSVPVLR
jgi:hypothetical protein